MILIERRESTTEAMSVLHEQLFCEHQSQCFTVDTIHNPDRLRHNQILTINSFVAKETPWLMQQT